MLAVINLEGKICQSYRFLALTVQAVKCYNNLGEDHEWPNEIVNKGRRQQNKIVCYCGYWILRGWGGTRNVLIVREYKKGPKLCKKAYSSHFKPFQAKTRARPGAALQTPPSLIDWLSQWVTALRRRHTQTVRDSYSSYKIDYFIVMKSFLNPEGHQNHICGSKVTVILL